MSVDASCETLRRAFEDLLGRAFCSPIRDDVFLVAAPFQYEDGDHPQFLAHVRDDRAWLEDFGNSIGRIRNLGIDVWDTPLDAQVRRIAASHGLSVERETLIVDIDMEENLSAQIGRFTSCLLQVDALRHVAREETVRFGDAVVEWLRVNNIMPIVDPRPAVIIGDRRYSLTASVFRSGEEYEDDDPTYIQAVSGRPALEHAHFVYTDLDMPSYRKVAIVDPTKEERLAPLLERLREVAAVASWGAAHRLSTWLQADDRERRAGQHDLLNSRPLF